LFNLVREGAEMKTGYIYVGKGESDDYFKIGQAKSADARLKDHHTANPWMSFPIVEECEAPEKVEAYLKNYFESRRKGGTDEWFSVSLSEMPEVIAKAKEYVADLLALKPQIEHLKSEMSTDILLEPSSSDEETYSQIKLLDEQIMRLNYEKERLQWRLMLRIGHRKGIDRIAGWASLIKRKFDQKSFRIDNPDLHQRYCVEKVERRFSIY
jgi:hypothetical protein